MNGVTIVQTLVVAEQRQAALPAELAGSLVLSVADALVSLVLKVGPHELQLLEDGTVRVCGGTPSDELSSEKSLRELLDQLLLCSSSVTPALLRASRRASRGNIGEFVRELEVALIPTNRGAARRALSRLCREVGAALQQSPQLRQAADQRARAHEQVEAAPAQVPALPPPTCAEPELVEELDIIELELSPSLPAAVVAPAAIAAPARVPAAPQTSDSPKPLTPGNFEIPDLEIPGRAKAELVQAVQWQPVEHTMRLELPSNAPTTTSRLGTGPIGYAPVGSCGAAAAQLEFVELCDEDVQEATTELPVKQPLRRVAPPKPPTPIKRFTEAPSHESPLLAISAAADSDPQTAEPFLLVVPTLEHASAATEGASMPVGGLFEFETSFFDSVPPQQNQGPFESPFGAACVEAFEDESSELLESYPLALEVVDADKCELASASFEPSAEDLAVCDSPELTQAQCDNTVLEVATIVEESEPAVFEPPPIQWRPQSLLEPVETGVAESLWPELESSLEPTEPPVDAADAPPQPEELKPWEPHKYSAELPHEVPVPDLDSRIMTFAVRDRDNATELRRGLRSLAGLTDDGSELSVTPPPMTYASEFSDQQSSESKSTLVRTLIGLGAVGALALVASSAVGPHARSAMAASVPVPQLQNPQECIAAIAVADVPVGASVRVTQPGREPSREQMQLGQTPLRFDGLVCGTPADLLVKLAENGWYRIPVEPARLNPGANPEPVHLAAVGKRLSNPRSHRHE